MFKNKCLRINSFANIRYDNITVSECDIIQKWSAKQILTIYFRYIIGVRNFEHYKFVNFENFTVWFKQSKQNIFELHIKRNMLGGQRNKMIIKHSKRYM